MRFLHSNPAAVISNLGINLMLPYMLKSFPKVSSTFLLAVLYFLTFLIKWFQLSFFTLTKSSDAILFG